MNCVFCNDKPSDYRAFTCAPRMVISMPLCEKCLSDNSELFTFWHSLAPRISVPASVREKWAREILIDSLKCRLPKAEIIVARQGQKTCASFFALERN